ncbi:MAG: SusD/RagB family nutrient-binding outer membrane lipoprotein [Luteibaculum sp.]
MRLKYFNIFLLALLTFAFAGCKKDWLDVNDDPETTSEVDPEFLIYNAQLQYSVNRTSEIGLSGAMWSQLWASGGSASVFLNPERYNFSTFTTGNTWRAHFPTSLNNLKFAAQIAETGDNPQPLIAAQAKIMRALVYYTTSVLWEDIPYSEALDPDIEYPKFDAQEQIMNGLLGELDNAIASIPDGINSDEVGITNDFYYSGNMGKWARLARSLKFRILVLMAEKDPSKQAMLTQMLSEGNMVDANSEALFSFYDESGHYNPNWNVLFQFAGGQNLFYFASEVTVETMKKYNDPRLPIYFFPGPDTTGIKGVTAGSSQGSYTKDGRLSLNVIKRDMPEKVFTYTEQLFLEAEAEYKYGSLANAQQKLNAAITESMNYWGVSQGDITTYLAQPSLVLPSPGVDEEGGLQIIAEQTWIAFIDKPIEAWTSWRRMKYPRLSLPIGAPTNGIVRRLPYPPDELSANRSAPGQKPLDQPMWFETRPEN